MAKYVAQQTGKNVEDVPYDVLTSPQLKKNSDKLHSFKLLMVTTDVA